MERNSIKQSKTNNVVVSIICGILTVFGITVSIVSFTGGSNGIWMVADVAFIVASVLVCYFAICGYKRPHGNLLKYNILIFAATRVLCVYIMVQHEEAWNAVNNAIMIGLLCYIAGRLHRIKQNLVFMIIVTILVLIEIITGFVQEIVTIGVFAQLIIWINICLAYVLRYKEHREVGLVDKGKE